MHHKNLAHQCKGQLFFLNKITRISHKNFQTYSMKWVKKSYTELIFVKVIILYQIIYNLLRLNQKTIFFIIKRIYYILVCNKYKITRVVKMNLINSKILTINKCKVQKNALLITQISKKVLYLHIKMSTQVKDKIW